MAAEVLPTLDLLVLLVVLRLDGEAYGVTIADGVGAVRGRPVSMAAVYTALERLEERGLVVGELGAPTAERGGRAKRFIRATPRGLEAVKATRRALTDMWTGIPALTERRS